MKDCQLRLISWIEKSSNGLDRQNHEDANVFQLLFLFQHFKFPKKNNTSMIPMYRSNFIRYP